MFHDMINEVEYRMEKKKDNEGKKKKEGKMKKRLEQKKRREKKEKKVKFRFPRSGGFHYCQTSRKGRKDVFLPHSLNLD